MGSRVMTTDGRADGLEARARQSLGASDEAIYELVLDALAARRCRGRLVDVGCGTGRFHARARNRFDAYVGVDALAHPGFPSDADFRRADLDREDLPVDDGAADVVVSIETIEHLENPRRLLREMTRSVRPGGWVIVTTPNQLSLLSLMTLVVKKRFGAFQDGSYPAHRVALLEVDLRRIAEECGLAEVEVRYTGRGRLALTPWHYPAWLGRWFPRACSDNVMLAARRPGDPGRSIR